MENKTKGYRQRTDFLWQYIGFDFAILIIYSMISGSISNWTLTLVLTDPIVLVLLSIIVLAIASTTWKRFFNRTVIISDNGITFKTRFKQRVIGVDEIKSINIKKPFLRAEQSVYSIVELELKNRKRAIHIRTASYKHTDVLLEELIQLREHITATKDKSEKQA